MNAETAKSGSLNSRKNKVGAIFSISPKKFDKLKKDSKNNKK
jgi:hypothetical protein